MKYKIKSETALLAVDNEQRQEGKKDLANYILSCDTKSLNDVIKQTGKMKDASSDLKQQQASRMELIRKAAECAQEVLINTKVHPILFAAAMRDLLQFGRGKHRSIIIVGLTNCGKTFLLNPILGGGGGGYLKFAYPLADLIFPIEENFFTAPFFDF